MGYRCHQHGIRLAKDRRHLVAECDDCDWTISQTLEASLNTAPFYRKAKQHTEKTGHTVNLAHTHAVEYRRL